MKYYRNSSKTKFICFDNSIVIVISESPKRNVFEIFHAPFKKDEGEVYEDSTHEEFFKEYIKLTSFMNVISDLK